MHSKVSLDLRPAGSGPPVWHTARQCVAMPLTQRSAQTINVCCTAASPPREASCLGVGEGGEYPLGCKEPSSTKLCPLQHSQMRERLMIGSMARHDMAGFSVQARCNDGALHFLQEIGSA